MNNKEHRNDTKTTAQRDVLTKRDSMHLIGKKRELELSLNWLPLSEHADVVIEINRIDGLLFSSDNRQSYLHAKLTRMFKEPTFCCKFITFIKGA